jgi:hypothetical protein
MKFRSFIHSYINIQMNWLPVVQNFRQIVESVPGVGTLTTGIFGATFETKTESAPTSIYIYNQKDVILGSDTYQNGRERSKPARDFITTGGLLEPDGAPFTLAEVLFAFHELHKLYFFYNLSLFGLGFTAMVLTPLLSACETGLQRNDQGEAAEKRKEHATYKPLWNRSDNEAPFLYRLA